MLLPQSIFRLYDIRGVYPQTINEEYAEVIGKSFGTYLANNDLGKVVIGRDNRQSSLSLSAGFIQGLLTTGCSVVDIGVSMTPVIHFLTCTGDFDAGIMVTASHNPKEYNGFRFDLKNAVSFFGSDLQSLYTISQKENFIVAATPGKYVVQDMLNEYKKYIIDAFKIKNRFKVALDCGNGTASLVAEDIFRSIGCEVVPMYCDIDGDFPHGIPDPENRVFMDKLREKVLEAHADIGLAFDTDVDRFGVVDALGNVYETDKLLMFFAKHLLPRNRGAKVIYDVKSSGILAELITSYGGVPKMLRTGHPYFTQEIKKGAFLGCEFSGHAYFGKDQYGKGYFGYDDGIYAACMVLSILDQIYPNSFADSVSEFPVRAHTNELKLKCPDAMKFGIINTISSNIKPAAGILSVTSLDGVRVQLSKTGWFLIRASNTSPLLSVRAEGLDEAEVGLMLSTVKEILTPFDVVDLTPLATADVYLS